MTGAELLGEGLVLMLVGMGTVFTFLALLVAATSLMSTTVARFFHDGVDDGARGEPDRGELLAVVGAAVAAYRNRDSSVSKRR